MTAGKKVLEYFIDAGILALTMLVLFFVGMIPVWLASWIAFAVCVLIITVASLAFSAVLNPGTPRVFREAWFELREKASNRWRKS